MVAVVRGVFEPMFTLKYALRQGGPKRLYLTHEGKWQNTVLTIDDTTVGTFANQKALKKGDRFILQDDLVLDVKLLKSGLRIRRNGKPIPGSSDYSKGNAHIAIIAVAAAGIINLFFTLVALILIILDVIFGINVFANLGVVPPNLVALAFSTTVEGLIFLGLSYWLSKYVSMLVLIVAIALQTANIGLNIMDVVQSNSSGGTSIISFKILILLGMLWGVSPLQKFKAQKAALEAEDTI
ncbi:MAG: hypothetical protein F6J87_12285 [Spirulina sp. SIO3F2]|nr:hypothetical protein [Spirulina sp. SIO3F2]